MIKGDNHTAGRWIIEGDLTSYFDTVHHKLLMGCVRKRIQDKRFLDLLWNLLKAGCIDKGLFCASDEGVPQGGVLSPLLSNIMLNEFDQWLESRYLSKKARKDRWYWNSSLARPLAVQEGRKWLPAVAYSRYTDDFVVIVKGTKQQAEVLKEECREFLETKLKLQLNSEKTAITHTDPYSPTSRVIMIDSSSFCPPSVVLRFTERVIVWRTITTTALRLSPGRSNL